MSAFCASFTASVCRSFPPDFQPPGWLAGRRDHFARLTRPRAGRARRDPHWKRHNVNKYLRDWLRVSASHLGLTAGMIARRASDKRLIEPVAEAGVRSVLGLAEVSLNAARRGADGAVHLGGCVDLQRVSGAAIATTRLVDRASLVMRSIMSALPIWRRRTTCRHS